MSLWIQLGRAGDILNILPMLWADAQAGRRQKLMVAKDYAGLLEGCSYVTPVIFDGGAHELERAVGQARGMGEPIICTQVNAGTTAVKDLVYKPAGLEHAVTTNYQKEMYRVAGRLAEWAEHPLVLDKRNPEREAELLKLLPKTSKKIVLVAADGISSPFPCKALVMELLKARKYLPIDLGSVRAERLFDLLALYERAFALVAIDSAPLHLANVVPSLPVLALVNDKPLLWNGSSWRANHLAYCRYSDFAGQAVKMLDALGAYQKPTSNMGVVHVYNGLDESEPMTPPDKHWTFLPIERGMVGRTDKQGNPFLKDCLKMAMQKAGSSGWVVLSRPGLKLRKDIATVLLTNPRQAYAYRLNEVNGYQHYAPIIDLFAAPVKWWNENLKVIPELRFSRDFFWSQALWALFKADSGRDLTGVVTRKASLTVKGTAEPSESAAANLEAQKKVWAGLRITGRYNEVSRQLSALTLDTSALPPHAYNPSIIKHQSKLVMTYRYHFAGDMRTRLGIATLKNNKLENPQDLKIPGYSVEDAKLFTFHGETWLSWVESDIGSGPVPHCIVKYGRLEHGLKVSEVHQVEVGANDFKHMEKNWCFFESDENLFCVYRAEREHIVLQIQGKKIINEYKLPPVVWPYGEIRGGVVVAYGHQFLRFFHSRSEAGIGEREQRYFVGALVMEHQPPFKVVALSSKPILYGSELPDCGQYPYKPRVVFPGGAMPYADDWLLAVGLNDCECAVVKVGVRDLNLREN